MKIVSYRQATGSDLVEYRENRARLNDRVAEDAVVLLPQSIVEYGRYPESRGYVDISTPDNDIDFYTEQREGDLPVTAAELKKAHTIFMSQAQIALVGLNNILFNR